MKSVVNTSFDYRLTKNEKNIPTGGLTVDLLVKSLEEFTDEKMDEWHDIITQNLSKLIFLYFISKNEPVRLEVPKPVKVGKDEFGRDSIIYNTNLMDLGKVYEIEFKNEKWALRKNEKTVEFLKFYPDKNE